MRNPTRSTIAAILILFAGVNSHAVNAKDCVVLLHGLARTSISMLYIEKQLESARYFVVNRNYPSRKKSIPELAKDAIPNAIKACPTNTRIHFVTHSMGGIILRQYLTEVEHTKALNAIPFEMGRVVMLAPPNDGNELASRANEWRIARWFAGPALKDLADTGNNIPARLGPASYELGIIAGEKSISPIVSRILPGPDDGKVSVAATKLEGMSDHIVLPINHTMITLNQEVVRHTLAFIENGSFSAIMLDE